MTQDISITHYDIQALIDNELSWEEEKRVRDLLVNDKSLAKYHEDMRLQKILLRRWWDKLGKTADPEMANELKENRREFASAG